MMHGPIYIRFELTQSYIHYWHFVNGTTNGIQNQAAVLTADCYIKHANTLISTLHHSKLFSVWVPKLQSPETEANLAIRPKKLNRSMLVSIPVINEKKVIWKLCLPLLTLRTVNSVTYSYGTSAVLSKFLVAKKKQILDRRFPVRTILLPFFLCQISGSVFRLDRTFQASAQCTVHRHYLILCSNQIPLNVLLHLSFDILTYLLIFFSVELQCLKWMF